MPLSSCHVLRPARWRPLSVSLNCETLCLNAPPYDVSSPPLSRFCCQHVSYRIYAASNKKLPPRWTTRYAALLAISSKLIERPFLSSEINTFNSYDYPLIALMSASQRLPLIVSHSSTSAPCDFLFKCAVYKYTYLLTYLLTYIMDNKKVSLLILGQALIEANVNRL